MRKIKVALFICESFLIFVSFALAAQQPQVVMLPKPQTSAGKPLMQVLKQRITSRQFSAKELDLQTLSDLLWAGFGISRPDGKRTAPSARNMQEIDNYLAKADGLFRYNAIQNSLELILAQDIREAAGKQDFVKSAPVNLIYVADLAKMKDMKDQKDFYAAIDTGFIAENVYLFCASADLATVVRGSFDQETLSRAMKLKENQKIIITQTVGYQKRE
ncbi:MAG: SagB/ThcOx family dehydrogenase [Candidatus Omnitrophica bacterium]|nr:SagB/ThcOx family dehydrogenase [Candidatus Omnitrophota bacterium]